MYILIVASVIFGILDIIFGIIDLKNKKYKDGIRLILIALILFINSIGLYNKYYKNNVVFFDTTINNYYYIGEN